MINIAMVLSPAAQRAWKGIHHADKAIWIPFLRRWRAGDDTTKALL